MITNEQKLVYTLTNPELVNWSKEVWKDIWEDYLTACDWMALDDDCSIGEIMEEMPFLNWYEYCQLNNIYVKEQL
jgi:hypothetical protein